MEYKTIGELSMQAQTVGERDEQVTYEDEDDNVTLVSCAKIAFKAFYIRSTTDDTTDNSTAADATATPVLTKQETVVERENKHERQPFVSLSVDNSRKSLSLQVRPESSETTPPQQHISVRRRFYEFYRAPISTFWAFVLAHLLFLLLYTYMCLVETAPHPTVIEYIVVAYVGNLFLEQIRKVILLLLFNKQGAQ